LTEIKKIVTKSCSACSKGQILLQFDFPLDIAHKQFFADSKFIESKAYADRGILYVEDANLVAMGPFGSNRLNIRCKTNSCDDSVAIVEGILRNIKG